MQKPVIETENFSFTYPHETEPCIKDINLKMYDGDYALVLGPSGCGKSTLFLALCGVVPKTTGGEKTGTIKIEDVPVEETSMAELATKLGLILQDPEAQIICLKVIDEVSFGLENLMFPPEEILKRVEEALETVGLKNRENATVWELSGGQKQKVAIATYIVMRPNIILLDNPCSNLDPRMTTDVLKTLKKLNQEQGITVVIIEHKVDELIEQVTRVILMNEKGTIVAQGDPRQVFLENRDVILKLGVWIPQMMELGLKLQEAGIPIKTIPITVDDAEKELKNIIKKVQTEKAESIFKPRIIPETTNILEVHDLSFTYPTGVQALKNVSFEIKKGDFVGILGENGAGKTTLAKHLIGLLPPPEGKVLISRKDASKYTQFELTQTLGYCFQYPGHQFVTDTAYDEVAYSLRVRNIPEETIKEKCSEVLKVVGLTGLEGKAPQSLSMGQQRRLSVATMLVLDQPILILDEPTMGQSYSDNWALFNLLTKLNKTRGLTPIVITHDMRVTAEFANTAVVMSLGNVIFTGPVRELFGKPELLDAASLYAPPIVHLSKRLHERNHQIPEVLLSSDELVGILK